MLELRDDDLQLLGSHHLLNVTGVAIEHENQSLIVKIIHLRLKLRDIVNSIAFREVEGWNCWTRRLIIP